MEVSGGTVGGLLAEKNELSSSIIKSERETYLSTTWSLATRDVSQSNADPISGSATMALGASAASPAVLLKSQYQAYEHHLPMFMTSYLAASRIQFFSKYLMPSREIATAFKMVFGEAAVTLKILLKMLI